MKKLRSIESFGGIDAKSDNLLFDAFEDHKAYRSALNFSKTLLVGRKGSGKSAVFERISKIDEAGVRSLGFTFSNYPWDYHNLQRQVGVPLEERYRESWKYFICMAAARLTAGTSDGPWHSQDAFTKAQQLKSFMEDSYGALDPDLTRIFQPQRQLRFKGGLRSWGASVDGEMVEVRNLPKFYSEINQSITGAIVTCLRPNKKYYLCFDELDIGFDPNDDEYKARLIGLIRAAKFFNDAVRSAGKQFSVIVLLRDDIWRRLKFEDKNKLTQSQVAEIRWDEAGEHDLRGLMERRFSALLGSGKKVTWSEVFNEQRRMRGSQQKYDYICDRTLLRPRDIIQYCNETLSAFHASSEKSDLFDNEHVQAAESKYSDYFLQELDDELHKHSEKFEKYFEVLKGLSGLSFAKQEFEAAWFERKTLFNAADTADDALESLFEFSIIGFLATGGRGAGSKYIWRYQDPGAKYSDAAKTYTVHPGLKNVLDLKLYRRNTKKK